MLKSDAFKELDMNLDQHSETAALGMSGEYHCQIVRDGKVIDEWTEKNLVVNEGLNSMLNVTFNAAAQITTWYVGVFEGNYTPVATVTAASIAASSTECTAYASSTRPEFVEATALSLIHI